MKFDDWFNESEAFSCRAERFYNDLASYHADMVGDQTIVKWLKAAYEEGYNQAKYDVMKLYWDDGK